MRLRPALLLMLVLAASSLTGRSAFTSYSDVRAVLAALADILPPDLKGTDQPALEAAWPAWIAEHDREIRQRLQRGDDDTIVNWLLLGTSFTSQPRAASGSSADSTKLPEAIAARTRDLIAALADPGRDERRLFARQLLAKEGYRVDVAAERARTASHLFAEAERVILEQQQHARELEAARRLGDSSEEFAARSRLFRERGLSLDTSIPPSFALERALQRTATLGLVERGSVRRVAVIGPGLDFSDKSSGYDFYPQQTLQPYALLDTLVRLGLSDPATVQIATFDISPRVNDHLTRARARARAGSPYVVRLPFDLGIPWKPDVVEYWRRLGDRIGTETPGGRPVAAARTLDVRTVRIRPHIASRVVPEDFNIVAQRFDGPPFDLVVATNVFVYYDTLDQSLALANVEAMLRPGGLLLSNNALLELPALRMRSVGYLTVQYSDRPDDGDHVVWYRRGSE